MTAPAPNATPNKKDTRKRCGVCGKKFTPKHANQRYHPACSSSARKPVKAKRKPKVVPLTNPFVATLIRAARYAGYVQIFEGITVAQLHELRAMVKLRVQFTQTGGYDESGRAYVGHLSHIHAVMGSGGMGKFTPDNLVVCDGNYNRSFGTTRLGYGSCIAPLKERAKWQLEKSQTDAEVMELIIECIGRATWNEFAKVAKLLPSGRQMLVDSLLKLLNPTDPAHAHHLRAVRDASTSPRALRHIHEALTGKPTFEPYVPCCTLEDVVVHELERMSKYRPDLAQVHAGLLEAIEVYGEVHGRRAHFEFLGNEYRVFMDMLHGDEVDMQFVSTVVERCRVIPVYRAPVETFVSPVFAPTPEQQARLARLEARIAARHAAEVESDTPEQEPSEWDVPW